MVELIKGFVVNFGLSRNAKDHDFLSGLHDKKPKQVKHREFADYHTFVI